MKKLHTLLTYISSNRIWLITLLCLDLFFIFLVWVAYPEYFLSLVGLMIFVSLAAFIIPLVISIHKRSKIDTAFRRFLLEPDDTNEYLLCENIPASIRPYIRELGQYFINGCTGLYFMVDVSEPTNLCYNEQEWTE